MDTLRNFNFKYIFMPEIFLAAVMNYTVNGMRLDAVSYYLGKNSSILNLKSNIYSFTCRPVWKRKQII